MFDDPKKELNRLDAELRAQAYEDQLEMLQNQEVPSLEDLFEYEDSDWLSDTDHTLQEADDGYPPASDRGRGMRSDAVDFSRTVFTENTLDDNSAVFVEKRKKPKKQEKQPQKKKKESAGCLPFIIFMELAGIAGILWWWYRWMR